MADNQTNGTANGAASSNWTVDVQRGVTWTMILVFAATFVGMGIKVLIAGDVPTIIDLFKNAQSVVNNIIMILIGFYFGSSKGSKDKDDTTNKVMESLIPPTPSVAVPELKPWWNKLTDAERTAITTSINPKVIEFVKAPVSMQPAPDDLAMLVAQGLLTQDRADTIKST